MPPQYRMVLVLHDMEELRTCRGRADTGDARGHGAGAAASSATVRAAASWPHLAKRRRAGPDPCRCRGAAPAALPAAYSPRSPTTWMGLWTMPCASEMDRHIEDCEPCQAFLSSLKQAVAQCRSYRPALRVTALERTAPGTGTKVPGGGRRASGKERRMNPCKRKFHLRIGLRPPLALTSVLGNILLPPKKSCNAITRHSVSSCGPM